MFLKVWTWALIPVAVLLLMVAVALIYWVFPNVERPLGVITSGAATAVIMRSLASVGSSFNVANSSS